MARQAAKKKAQPANQPRPAARRRKKKAMPFGSPKEPQIDGEWFKSRAKALGLTQKDLALALRRHTSEISRTLGGSRIFTSAEAARLSVLLQTSGDEILRRMGLPVFSRGVLIVGKILGDGQVSPVSGRKGGQIRSTDMPPGAEALIAETEGGPLSPYNGAAIIYLPAAKDNPAPPDVFGRLCIVEVDNQIVPLIGTLGKASERGKVTLEIFGTGSKLTVSKVHRTSAVLAIILA